MDYFTWWLIFALFFQGFNCSYADDSSENRYAKKAGGPRCKDRPRRCRSAFGPQKPKCERSSMVPCLEERALFESLDGKHVLCDTRTDGGGWILIQRIRTPGHHNEQTWVKYRDGWGSFDQDFWLGNEMIRKLTMAGYTDLRIDMKYKGRDHFASYKNFTLTDEADFYRMSYNTAGYRGSTQDQLVYSRNMKFSTYDSGARILCNSWAGWWFPTVNGHCGAANFNGIVGCKHYLKGLYWNVLTGYYDSLDSVEMKLRKPNP
ncbi:ficolin-1-A-like [Physella acuta]|uniref:ficolin-1-A-like n=1 Tax=Physella acuta TaxID=109671 RepID=UPI0027DAFEA5|nr:ficolin-1-A-like [Physella acuta]